MLGILIFELKSIYPGILLEKTGSQSFSLAIQGDLYFNGTLMFQELK